METLKLINVDLILALLWWDLVPHLVRRLGLTDDSDSFLTVAMTRCACTVIAAIAWLYARMALAGERIPWFWEDRYFLPCALLAVTTSVLCGVCRRLVTSRANRSAFSDGKDVPRRPDHGSAGPDDVGA
jgi:hypothetical protein